MVAVFFVLLSQKENLQILLVFRKCDVAQNLRMLRHAITLASPVCVRLEKIAWLASHCYLCREKNITNVVLRGVVSRRRSARRFVTYLKSY